MAAESDFYPKAVDDLKIIASLQKEKLFKLFHTLSELKDEEGIGLEDIMDTIEDYELNKGQKTAIDSLLFNLSYMINDETMMKSFTQFVETKLPEYKEPFVEILTLLNELNIPEQIRKKEAIRESDFHGLKHLGSFSLEPQYRVIEYGNKRELFPLITCDLILHEVVPSLHPNEPEKTNVDKVSFQFLPSTLDRVIDEFMNVKEKLQKQKDLIYLKER